jgi:hypothetical protein
MKIFRLTSSIEMTAEVLSVTAHRLIRWGITEGQAHTLARVITLDTDATDSTVEDAVINALVAAKEAMDEVPQIEYVAGRRCDLQRRLDGKQ